MSIALRRSSAHSNTSTGSTVKTSEVLLISARKITSAAIAAYVDGAAAATAFVFTLDNGQRFEAHEVKIAGKWEPVTVERASAIVDGHTVALGETAPELAEVAGEGDAREPSGHPAGSW